LTQLEQVASLLKGKKIHRGLAFWVSTTATAKRLAERIGYVETIEKAGGNVVVDTCIDEPCWTVYKDMVGMTDSPKCAYYRRFKDVIVSSMKDCVDAALKGEFE
jgi:predicted aconitase